jgi:hypothetical protein
VHQRRQWLLVWEDSIFLVSSFLETCWSKYYYNSGPKYHWIVIPFRLLLTYVLKFTLKANDSDSWWTYLICCTIISFTSGMTGLEMPV